MNYLALARKWRPRSFSELVGQDHVVRALTNALETQRIHHAWLFTGTRGVGKTTLARILAKSLNCETGITSNPCGKCSACLEIDQGRFVDYIEVDAASRRGVDEITPLLEQAIYAPSRGRFKIYTIDEVHMLTTHAFNAMLKTLEEPPAHLKFILATTDPQKIPVTVLSRCIQYNLKQMSPEAVVEHLQHLLDEEQVEYEKSALQLIARGAAGSMRDALSLTDQAIAFSGNHITTQAMQDMLGSIDQSYLVNLVKALLAGDATMVLELADAIADRGFSYEGALADLAIMLSHITMEQRLPGTLDSDDPLYEDMMTVVQTANHDVLQLFYSIAVHGRKELALAPDEYAGFVMICFRMLSLVNTPVIQQELQQAASVTPKVQSEPTAEETKKKQLSNDASYTAVEATVDVVAVEESVEQPEVSIEAEESVMPAEPALPSDPEPEPEVALAPASEESTPELEAKPMPAPEPEPTPEAAKPNPEPLNSSPNEMSEADWDRIYDHAPTDYDGDVVAEPMGDDGFDLAWAPHSAESESKFRLQSMNQERWIELTKELELDGMARELLLNSQWLGLEDKTIHLKVFLKNAEELAVKSTLTTALTEYFSEVVKLRFETGETGDATARAQILKEQAARQQAAEELVAADPYVKSLIEQFGANVVDNSVQVLSSD